PVEIWHRIFEYACSDNGTTSLSLSEASRSLRGLSRRYRYHSVMIVSWKMLLRFEAHFCSLHPLAEERRYTTNLFVSLPDLCSDAYPEGHVGFEALLMEQPDRTRTYKPDDEDEGMSSEDVGYEMQAISEEERQELAEEIEDIQRSAAKNRLFHGQDLSQLSIDSSALGKLEYKTYSALRRLLDAAAPSLITFTFCWYPAAYIYLEAVVPILPKLQWLALYVGKPEWQCGRYHTPTEYLLRDCAAPNLFPALRQLRI
ncbi:hypothetical protein DFP72DRAFT_743875, partial [Ephemerocybe angulata]